MEQDNATHTSKSYKIYIGCEPRKMFSIYTKSDEMLSRTHTVKT